VLGSDDPMKVQKEWLNATTLSFPVDVADVKANALAIGPPN